MANRELENILAGYKTFRNLYESDYRGLFEELGKYGQSPKTVIVSCCDSRVDPGIILNRKPGSLYVIRNVANLVPPYEADNHYHGTSAALEFGVRMLKVEHIIVLGHSGCGGIGGLLKDPDLTEGESFINNWVKIAKKARDLTNELYPNTDIDEKIDHCGKLAIINSLENLRTFPWIEEKVQRKELFLHGWYFNINTGLIKSYNSKENRFTDIIGSMDETAL